MKRNSLILIICFASWALVSAAYADEASPKFSYQEKNPDEEMVESAAVLIEWAKGELMEHQGEGLYKNRIQDEQLVQDMITLANEYRDKGAAAKKAGDIRKSRMFYSVAEAAAHYAARMPHMLESRLLE